jgi:DNA-binding SARP family transcriptional activator
MGTLRIWLFGAVRLEHDDFAVDPATVHPVQGLLAYLLLHRERVHSREALAGVFWGDRTDDKARRCLNTAVWRLRSALEPDGVDRGAYLISNGGGELGFNWTSDHWLDVAVFEDRVSRALVRSRQEMRAADVECLREAVQLCRGELLEGFYDDWALRERERLRLLYLRCLRRLMRVYREQGALEESLACAQQILACDPLREEIHREVMRLHCDLGQRALAVRQYQRCREILAGELGILPMEETQALYARIAGHACPDAGQLVVAGSACLQQALRQVRQAMDESALAQAKLRRAVAQLEQLLPQSAASTQQARSE